jgi:hypothetical protein
LRGILAGVALVMLMSLTPAYSQMTQTFGRISPGTIPSSGLSAQMKRASRFTFGSTGSISKLCAYLDGNGGVSGTQRYRLGLYRDNGGVPGAKVFETREQMISSGTAARWYCLDAPVIPVSAGSYWISIHTGGTAGVIRDYYDGAANWYGNFDAYEDGATMTFGAGNAGSGTLTLSAEYFPDSQMRAAGRTTVGTLPSAGMSTNFKRGSSFTMPERGKLYSIAAYLDGNGTPGADAGETVGYAIYEDANGVPGAKVFSASGFNVSSGQPGLWRATFLNPNLAPTLDAGKYWLVLHTGSQTGIARNFADGTGNWYGNADTFTDGASDPFGAGNAGNGTISAFVAYRPGDGLTNVLGRTDIGAQPSSGLSANFTRWSHFTIKDNIPTLTGLHAYLDGLGGAGGSQKVRMVVYHLATERGETWYMKVAESDEVTIPAGMPPQWVDFHVPPTTLVSYPGTHEIALQTGDTAGVIRDYGDNRPDPDGNWGAIADSYADGPIQTIPEYGHLPAPGSVTLSVYADYSITPP